MPNLSVKNTLEHVVTALRARAKRHHRSRQGEVLAIVKAAAAEPPRASFDLDALPAQFQATGVSS